VGEIWQDDLALGLGRSAPLRSLVPHAPSFGLIVGVAFANALIVVLALLAIWLGQPPEAR
jgi:tetrahydromethanopterin S-methyltransferase subunit F